MPASPDVPTLAMPLEMDDGDEFGRRVLVHQLAGGRDCAELLDHDMAAPTMLLEGRQTLPVSVDWASRPRWRRMPESRRRGRQNGRRVR